MHHRIDQRGVSKRATRSSVGEANTNAPIIEADAVPIMGIGAVSIELIWWKLELLGHTHSIVTEALNQFAVVVDREPAFSLLRTSERQRQLGGRHWR